MDDVVVLVPVEQIEGAYRRYRDLMKEIGIPIQVKKSEVWLPAGAVKPEGLAIPLVDRPRVMKQQVISVTVVPDTPLDSGALVLDNAPEIMSVLQKRREMLSKLVHLVRAGLPVQQCFAILKAMTASDVTWVMRTVGIRDAVAAQLDGMVKQCLCEVGQLEQADPKQLERMWHSMKRGGLGLTSASLNSKPARAASWLACLPMLQKRLGEADVGLLCATCPDLKTALAEVRQLTQRMSGDDREVEMPTAGDVPLKQKHMATNVMLATYNEWMANSGISLEDQAWARSCGGKGGAWLQAPRHESHLMTNDEFRMALQLRMRCPVTRGIERCALETGGHPCGCVNDHFGAHVLSCPKAGGLVRRHDAMCGVFANNLKLLGCEAVSREQFLPADEAGFAPRMDIVAVAPLTGAQLKIDLTVAHPLSAMAMRANAAKIDGVAAKLAEHGKRRLYGHWQVKPAAFETGGRPGESLVDMVKPLLPLGNDRSQVANDFWQSMAVVLQRENARTLLLSLRAG